MHYFWTEHLGEAGALAELSRSESEHLFKILRFRRGDRGGLLDGRGGRGVFEVGEDRELRILERSVLPEPEYKVSLWCAAPRKNKLDILLKQASELGVWSVRFLECEFSVAKPENFERMNALLIEGCKQSGNPFLPRLLPTAKLDEAPELAKGAFLCYGDVVPGGELPRPPEKGEVIFLVGPEGGFSPRELETLRSAAAPLNLGRYILRLETAAAAGVAVLNCLK